MFYGIAELVVVSGRLWVSDLDLAAHKCHAFRVRKIVCYGVLTSYKTLFYHYPRRHNNRRNTMQTQILNIIQIIFPIIFLVGLCAAIVKK